ncbi:PAS domain S-box protein [Desulfonatronum parangueonense]
MPTPQDEVTRLQAALDAANAEIARLVSRHGKDRRAMEDLRGSVANLRALFEDAPEAIFIINQVEETIDLNQTATQLFQAPKEQLKKLNLCRELFRPRGPLEKFAEIQLRLDTDQSIDFHWVAQRLDGSLFPVEVTLKKTTWNGQEAFLVVIQDITQRRQAKNLLRQRRKQLAVLLDGNPIATFVIDTSHRVIFWNRACEILTGVPKAQCLGKPVDSRIFYSGAVRPVLADLVLDMDQDTIQALYKDKNLRPSSFIPEAFEATDRLIIQDKPRFIYFLAARCRDERGRVIGAIETIQDITERTSAEQALMASKKLLTEVTANIPGVVYQYSADPHGQGRFTFISDGLRSLFGLPPERAIQDPEPFFSMAGPDVRNQFSGSLTATKPSASLVEFEFALDSGDGKKWFKNSALASVGKDGQILWNGMLTDITEIKRMELMRADVERMIRHDLKSPLTGIGGLAKLMLRDDLPDRQREIVATIYQSAMKLLHMIGHSMALFKMEEQTYRLQPEPFDLIKLLRSLHEEFQPSAQAKALQFKYLLENRPLTWEDSRQISGEAILLESLFANLIQNAVDAAPHGSTITIAVCSTKNHHEIDIHNFGAIPEQIRHNFFDRYVTCEKNHGTGIGTYSAMLIARTHQGDIRFTSSEEHGTHLIVSLPKTFDHSIAPTQQNRKNDLDSDSAGHRRPSPV